MIAPENFVLALKKVGLNFFTGVPDSLLKSFCAYVDDHLPSGQHITAANEGNAVAIASGYHLATGKSAVVYMQNSGLGNTINPLTSLADKEVYQIPMLLVIGWRGEPGLADEPQHVKQGRITLQQLNVLKIPYQILTAQSDVHAIATWARDQLSRTGAPIALVVKKNTFSSYKSSHSSHFATMKREDVLAQILELAGDASLVSTTGKTSREVFELRQKRQEPQRDFLTVGSMGHTSSIALGIALGQPLKKVVCLDGDGSMLMHMGALPIIGSLKPDNFLHVLLNNASHESVGGQPTVADRTNFKSIALASGYTQYAVATTVQELKTAWTWLAECKGPTMLEVRIIPGSRTDLGRPTTTPIENKHAFMAWIQR
jgi:phosphonopyruvate decarboxylase